MFKIEIEFNQKINFTYKISIDSNILTKNCYCYQNLKKHDINKNDKNNK